MILSTDKIRKAVNNLCIKANYQLPPDIYDALKASVKSEKSHLGKSVLQQLVSNAKLATTSHIALCQDTGLVVVFLEIGQGVQLTGHPLEQAVNQGIAEAYSQQYLRCSIVSDPILRQNTNDNTPAVIHTKIVSGNCVRIWVMIKGFGSENMSAVKMLKPIDGREGIKNFVLETVKKAGGNPCPPIVVGIGVGGTMEKAAILAKEALIRPIGSSNPQAHIAELEQEILHLINQTGIGPQGFGGSTTALAVNMMVYPTHIAGLPVAVNIGCHANRHGYLELEAGEDCDD